ncbi:hypothetical protein K443DRAFT_673062 [Laccaria amethystina LaAM-08-1]|uniref:Uncharacterized protein n=1 Tax=Laccaria amethystina LaAM-08-1 TaxID=1095629 RepID=A0A0C9XS29_9AGAR|nr:hypothetical protein K443DRAFT_673062 [Laccaria amethystina LaAM-08-1]
MRTDEIDASLKKARTPRIELDSMCYRQLLASLTHSTISQARSRQQRIPTQLYAMQQHP